MAACSTIAAHSHESLSANHALESIQGYDFDALRYYFDASDASGDELASQSHSRRSSSEFFRALNDYADTFDDDCFSDADDDNANDGDDYLPASLEGRATFSLPSHVFRSLIDAEEDEEEAPPIKRCETATRHMLRQLSARSERSSQRSHVASNSHSNTCRRKMIKMTISSFRSMLVSSRKSSS